MGRKAPAVRDLLTVEQEAEYLDLVAQGYPAGIAARRATGGTVTGTRLRNLRGRDPEFRARFEEAFQHGILHYREALREAARARALDGGSDRILEVELATHVPGYEHLRRDRLKVDARIENAIVLPPDALEKLTTEQLLALREILVEAGGDMIQEGEFVEIDEESPPGLSAAA